MKLAVKFSEDSIQVMEWQIRGGIRIHRCARGEMPDGAFVNGIVVNTVQVADALKGILKENGIHTKRAELCVGGMEIINKEIKIPRSGRRHVRRLIKNELLRMDALRGGYFFDYIEAEEQEGELVVYTVYLLPAELIRNYEQTLKRAGLTLERVEPVSRSLEKAAKLMGLADREDMTILVDAEKTETNVLLAGAGTKSIHRSLRVREETMEENVFIVSAFQNLAASTEPEDKLLDKLSEVLSKLVQFQSQNSRGRRVERLLMYGSIAQDSRFLEELQRRSGIDTQPLSIPETLMPAADAGRLLEKQVSYTLLGTVCGALLGEKKQLSFLQDQEDTERLSVKNQICFVAGLAALVATAVFYAVTAMGNNWQEEENRRMEDEIARLEQSEEYKRRLLLREQTMKLVSYNENSERCIRVMEETSRFETKLLTEVDKIVPPGITIVGYGFEDNTVSFSCRADEQDGPAEFAKIVSGAGLFEQVDYSGFSAYQDMNYATYYSFVLECGRQPQIRKGAAEQNDVEEE